MTFDGHLLEQVRRLEGKADKGEDWIEHLHQCWKKQKELTWHISNFDIQQKVQLKNMLVKNNPIIIQGIEETNEMRKRKLKRLEDGGISLKDERDAAKRQVKQQRREVYTSEELV